MEKETFDNGLSDLERERLSYIIEECSEVIKAATKILRHGYLSRNPDLSNSPTNQEALQLEIGDLRYAVSLLEANGDTGITKQHIHYQTGAAGT